MKDLDTSLLKLGNSTKTYMTFLILSCKAKKKV